MIHRYRVCLVLLTFAVILLAAGYHGQGVKLAKARTEAKQARFEALVQRRALQRKKIEIDLTQIGANGLRGPADGTVAVSYEFCIPDTKHCRDEVRRIDASVHFYPGSSGHIGAKKGQCLCIGSTSQKRWRDTLMSLAALSYVDRIIEAHFE